MEELKQRHLKLLYRQRGSASRTIDYDVVIENEEIDGERNEQFLQDMDGMSVEEDMPDINVHGETDEGEYKSIDRYQESEDEDNGEEDDLVVDTDDVDIPDFKDFSLTKLSTPITSMATIDVLQKLLEIVMVENVIKKKKTEFKSKLSRPRKLQIKLEIRVFEEFLRRCQQDLQTISDYNLSNNDLIYRSKQLSAMKHSLGESLLEIRRKTSNLTRNADVQKEWTEFENLKIVNELIFEPKTKSLQKYKPINLQLFDGNTGLLPTLQNLNKSLSEC